MRSPLGPGALKFISQMGRTLQQRDPRSILLKSEASVNG